MNGLSLWCSLVACLFASSGCANAKQLSSDEKCVELNSRAGELVAVGENTISITKVSQFENATENAEAIVIRAALDQWNAIHPRVPVDEMRRLAEAALPCVHRGYSALNLFAATVGLHSGEKSELAKFSRAWFFSAEAESQPIASLGRVVLMERRSDRAGAKAEIRRGIMRDSAVARRAGLLYLSGIFFPSDDAEGASWAMQAADSGDWRAQRLMALLFSVGRGVPKDERAAEKYVKLAGENPLDQPKLADDAIISIRPLPPTGQ